MLHILQDLTSDKSHEILQRLQREGIDTVLRSLGPFPRLGRSISPHPTAQALLPPVTSRFEYELVATQPRAYSPLVSAVDGHSLNQLCREDTALVLPLHPPTAILGWLVSTLAFGRQ